MGRYAIYFLLFLLSLAVFGCTRWPLPSGGPVFPLSLQRSTNSFDGSAARLPQPAGLQGPLLFIVPEAVRFLRPEPVRLSRNGNGSIQIRNGEILSVSWLIPEIPHCTLDPAGFSDATLSAAGYRPSVLHESSHLR